VVLDVPRSHPGSAAVPHLDLRQPVEEAEEPRPLDAEGHRAGIPVTAAAARQEERQVRLPTVAREDHGAVGVAVLAV
jgi:hypothetical protein